MGGYLAKFCEVLGGIEILRIGTRRGIVRGGRREEAMVEEQQRKREREGEISNE
jgi:hypothetical protein